MNKSLFLNSSFLIVAAIVTGVLFGALAPELAVRMKPAGELFVNTIRILVGPVVFCTVTAGIAQMHSIRQLGQVGLKAILYFEAASALALLAGIGAAVLLQPGEGFAAGMRLPAHAAPTVVDASAAPLLATLQSTFAASTVLQILVLAMACGVALVIAGERASPLAAWLARLAGWLYRIVNLVLKTAPLAAFSAMAFTVGQYGVSSLQPLLKFVGSLYLVTILFVMLVMGAVARWCGVSLWRFIVYLKEELVLVFGTASSVAAMPRLIEKMRLAGCSDTVAGVVIPAGYSFNLNGSNVYLGLAAVFILQALQVELRGMDYLALFAVAMVTSKGATGVAGSAFVALAATLATIPGLPGDGLLLIVGVERLLKCRSLANLIGNGIACIAVSAWARQLDRERLAVVARLDL